MADIMLRPKEVVCKWVDAFNNHDIEEITSLYHEDAINHQLKQFAQCSQENLRQQI